MMHLIPNTINYGDLNRDRSIDSIDLAMLRMHLLGFNMLTDDKAAVVDLNLDGSINAIDFAILRKYVLGMTKELPVKG
ncbi:dockerin type I repeat-containing protein [Acetivibrio cellulolyticus]|uniref:dockerin type I repeat-containing protein n=1 Tax=Acetivibrio cellulolyticus TaxID=35830 RepID=UPI0001E2F587|nr:dockerin type I domain-containing protein [Acetivibrio cellulolyticus]